MSILLAFAIEAWWAQLGEREEESLALAGLEVDFTGYVDGLEDVRRYNAERIEAARHLIDLSGPNPSSLGNAEFHSLMVAVVMYTSINLTPGTLGSLLETNRLSLITDARLRSRLVDWDRQQRFAEEQNAYMVAASRELDAFLKPRYPMNRILRLASDLENSGPPPASRFPADDTSLLADLEFTNHLAYASDVSVLVHGRVTKLQILAEEILEILRVDGNRGPN